MDEILLIGGGGHCRSCIDVIEQQNVFSILGVVDESLKVGEFVLGYPVIGRDADLPQLVKRCNFALITVGHIRSMEPRRSLFNYAISLGFEFPTIVSPLAYVSAHASIGAGTIVHHYAIVNASANVGRNCILNTKSLIEHNATVHDHCHISTNATINGGATIGSGSFLGSSSVCVEQARTNENAFIKAASVFKD